jgi:cobalt-zinc-cadmium efflux system outer membrane protein
MGRRTGRNRWLTKTFALLALTAGCRTAPIGGPDCVLTNLDVAGSEVTQSSSPPSRPVRRETQGPTFGQRLEVPPEIPGVAEPPINVPPYDPAKKAEREKLLAELYFTLPQIPPDPVPTQGRPLDLAELQQQAAMNHPAIRAAQAAVEAARGTAMQAGLPPNPAFGFEADTIGSGGTAGQQGPKYEQLIITAGKLKLAQSAALMDVVNAQVALRRTQIDIATQIRTAFFGVLVAEESLRLNYALCVFVDSLFGVQTDQVRAGQLAPYEPLTIRALAEQARVALMHARNRYQAAWRQLGAAIGEPTLMPGPLAGSAMMGEPDLPYDALRERMLHCHTDLLTAANNVVKARYELALARVTPIPDVSLKLVVQKDYTTPPFATTANVEVGVPIPVWDRNQGNIRKSEADVAKALEDIPAIKLDLLNKLADANERYLTNRQTADTYLLHVLPDQVKAYRGVLQHSQQDPDRASFGDIVTAQQLISTYLMTYLAALQAQWQAAADLAALAQLDDLYQFGPTKHGSASVGGKK